MKNRTRNALLSSLFTYGQFGIALGTTFFVTPLILRTLGARAYGLWLSSGEIIGYCFLLDFGVFAILPWLIAHADGQQEPDEIKRILSRGLAVAGGVAGLLAAAMLVGWRQIPVWLHLTAADWQTLDHPLAWLIVLLLVNLPFGLFPSLLMGLQDVRFLGGVNLVKAVTGPILTATLLLTGHGFYALAFGSALLAPVAGAVCLGRAKQVVPDLMRLWPRPTLVGVTRLFRESIGAWLGGAGVQLMERSGAVVLTSFGQPALVSVLVCTSRVGQILTQMAWVMPDSALVGLAQLSGEGKLERAREVMLSVLRLSLVLAGLMACMTMALNPAFVRIWVGGQYFGGLWLNSLLALEIFTATFTHALVTVVAVQGYRLPIGLATLLQGAIYLAAAVGLVGRLSLPGLIMADVLAPLGSTLPVSFWLLRSAFGLGPARLAREMCTLLLGRILPCLLPAWYYGYTRAREASLPELAGVGILITLVYLRAIGSQLSTFPLPPSVSSWLRRLRLV